MSFIILKFGGSSIADADRIRHVTGIIQSKYKENNNLAIVVSAVGNATDKLIALAGSAASGENVEPLFSEFRSDHTNCFDELIPAADEDSRLQLEELFKSLKNDLSLLSEEVNLTPKNRDKLLSYGELLSTLIVAGYLNAVNIPAEALDARKVILTDSQFGNAMVSYEESYDRIRKQFREREKMQIITGFLGANKEGETTTLGRSGSDYSAAIFGAALDADAIEIWTDVNGIMSADPKMVSDSKTISHLTYEEAMELAHGGAKVIFPPTMIPVMDKEIPIIVKNTFQPEHIGSRITKERNIEGEKAIGISSLSEITLIRIQGAGMIGLKGLIGRVFSSLAKENVNIILVSQVFSEHSICFAINPGDADSVVDRLEKELTIEIENHFIDKIKVEPDLSLVALVGEGMRHTPGISGNLFASLGRESINVVAIAQGSSERNISFIVKNGDVGKTLNTVHQTFFLKSERQKNIYIAGVGTVGSELISILAKSDGSNNLTLRGIASSRKMVIESGDIEFGQAIDSLKNSNLSFDLDQFLNAAKGDIGRKIFIDCTVDKELSEAYLKIMNSGFSIVTANKIANSMELNYYRQLRETAIANGVEFRYETNVGAGLPIIRTLRELIDSGDQISSIEGIFSGTMSYLFNTMTPELPFSQLVQDALKAGFTEPDPRQDLSGMDVARKLLILARETGAELEISDIKVESLLPEGSWKEESVETFLKLLSKFDDSARERVEKAKREGKVLRYIGSYENGKAEVSLQALDLDHPFSNLSGSENIVAFHTERYNRHPLVIKGPGAGASVTAAKLFTEIKAVGRSR